MFLFVLLDANCSGRTLATLLVAWVAIAMVISILLQWQHMWIVLMVLTLLFLILFCYIGYNAKRARWRAWLEQHRRATEEERERRIWTISGIRTVNHGEVLPHMESSRFADLPPSYSSVVLSVQPPTSESTRASPTPRIDESPENLKFEDPPPYSSVISIADDRNAEIPNEHPGTLSTASARKKNSNDVSTDEAHAARNSEADNTNGR